MVEMEKANLFLLPHEPGDLHSSTWEEAHKQGCRSLLESEKLSNKLLSPVYQQFLQDSSAVLRTFPQPGRNLKHVQ